MIFNFNFIFFNTGIQETKHLSTDADSSTDIKKILLVRKKFAKKLFFLRAAILQPL